MNPFFDGFSYDPGSGNPEVVAKIDAPYIFVFDHVIRRAGHEHLAVVQDIGTVDNFERFAPVMVRDQHANPAFLEVGNEVADIPDRNRVNPGKWLVQKQVFRVCCKASRNRRDSPSRPSAPACGS